MLSETRVAGADGEVNLARGPAGGSPLVLLHGVGRAWQDFSSLGWALAGRWHVHALDFRGHGRSDRTPGKYLVCDYVRDVVAVVSGAVDRPAVLYGHSLGAMAAAGAAAELGDLVRGVILEDPPFDTLGRTIRSTQFHGLFVGMRTLTGSRDSITTVARHLGDLQLNPPDRPIPIRLGELREATSLRFMAACLKLLDPEVWDPILEGRWLEGFDVAQVLAKISCPVLLLHGNVGEGGMLDDQAAAEVQRRLANCTRVRVPRAGHLIHQLERETTLRLTSEFLESIALAGDED
jgi:pimeloyl-ACP methyl ester carboxylesterase